MNFKKIKTHRLNIRRLIIEDAKSISYYRNIPEVAEFQSWESFSIEDAELLIHQMNDRHPETRGKWFQFGIEDSQSGELIGDIGFLNTDENNKSWIGFTLNSRHWHKGYAVEGVEAILKFYSGLGISAVWASTDPDNSRSHKLLARLGFCLYDARPGDHVYKR